MAMARNGVSVDDPGGSITAQLPASIDREPGGITDPLFAGLDGSPITTIDSRA